MSNEDYLAVTPETDRRVLVATSDTSFLALLAQHAIQEGFEVEQDEPSTITVNEGTHTDREHLPPLNWVMAKVAEEGWTAFDRYYYQRSKR